MKSEQWKTYRTRFLVKAKQLNSPLSFVDALGRQHSGRKGDYLVESSDGVISIAPRRIFEDIYVSMPQLGNDDILSGKSTVEESLPEGLASAVSPAGGPINRSNFAALEIEKVKLGKPPLGRQPARRIVPQPTRDRRDSTPRLGLM